MHFGSNLLTQKNVWMSCVKGFRIHLNAHRIEGGAFACGPSGQTNSVKGLDFDDRKRGSALSKASYEISGVSR